MQRLNYIKYYLLVTLIVLCTFSLSSQDFIVVVDAGHGGKDFGTNHYGVVEKKVNLAVAKLLKDKIVNESSGISVVLTRDKDVFVELRDRAKISNDIDADLFLSIHCDAIGAKKLRATTYGSTTQVMNIKQMKNLNFLSEEDRLERLDAMEKSIKMSDYVLEELETVAHRKILGTKQNPRDLAVIRETKAPSLIVELDYITYRESGKYLNSEKGQEELATALFNAVVRYRDYLVQLEGMEKTEDESIYISQVTKQKPDKDEKAQTVDENTTSFYIQFLCSGSQLNENSKSLKKIKGYDYTYYIDGGQYKYIQGSYPTLNEAENKLKEIKQIFPDAFIIKMRNGKRIK